MLHIGLSGIFSLLGSLAFAFLLVCLLLAYYSIMVTQSKGSGMTPV